MRGLSQPPGSSGGAKASRSTPHAAGTDLALLPNADGTYKVAVTSQESKALWIGRLSATSWSFLDDGTIYPLPSSDCCNVEGVTFLSASRVALVSLVSDMSDPQSDPANCNNKDEMVHIFDLQ
jgi:hypothetical protein